MAQTAGAACSAYRVAASAQNAPASYAGIALMASPSLMAYLFLWQTRCEWRHQLKRQQQNWRSNGGGGSGSSVMPSARIARRSKTERHGMAASADGYERRGIWRSVVWHRLVVQRGQQLSMAAISVAAYQRSVAAEKKHDARMLFSRTASSRSSHDIAVCGQTRISHWRTASAIRDGVHAMALAHRLRRQHAKA